MCVCVCVCVCVCECVFPCSLAGLPVSADSLTTPINSGSGWALVQICQLPHHILDLFFPSSPVQFSSVTQSCLTFCDPVNRSMPGLPVQHQLPEPTQTHVHWVGDAIQSSHLLSSPSPPAFKLSQHQGLFQIVSYLHQVAKVWELQLHHQSFQWIFRDDFL